MSITVAIMSYRYGHLAAHAIESVLGQTIQPDKVLFVDDGAGDCHHLRKLYPQIDIIERPANLGIVANFNNVLFNHVQTDRVMYLGADNWLHPACVAQIGAVPADIVSYDVRPYGELAHVLADRVGAKLDDTGFYRWCGPLHGSSMYNVQLARQVGGYAASGNKNSEEDSILFERMIKAGARRVHVDQPFLFYLRHGHNFQGAY